MALRIARTVAMTPPDGSNPSGFSRHRLFATANSIASSELGYWLEWHVVPLQPCLLERVHDFTGASQESFVPHQQHPLSVQPRGKVPSKIALDVLGPKVHRRWKADTTKGVCTLPVILLQYDWAQQPSQVPCRRVALGTGNRS